MTRFPWRRWTAAFLIAGTAFVAAAAATVAPPAGVTEVTTVEGITEYRLENGLKVLLFPDLSKPTITVNITYLVGSRHDRRRDLLLQNSKLTVRGRRCTFHLGERANELQRYPFTGDGKVLERSLGLSTPQTLVFHFDLTKTVSLATDFHDR